MRRHAAIAVPEELNANISAALLSSAPVRRVRGPGLDHKDIRSRSRDALAVILSVLLVAVFSIFGLLVYTLVRPRTTLAEEYERSLAEEAILQDLEERRLCPSCQRRVAADFIVCPTCHHQLRLRCVGCGRLLNPGWDVCPYCGLFVDQQLEEVEDTPTDEDAEAPAIDRFAAS